MVPTFIKPFPQHVTAGPWADFQGRYVVGSEFCGGVEVTERRGQRTLQAERVEAGWLQLREK